MGCFCLVVEFQRGEPATNKAIRYKTLTSTYKLNFCHLLGSSTDSNRRKRMEHKLCGHLPKLGPGPKTVLTFAGREMCSFFRLSITIDVGTRIRFNPQKGPFFRELDKHPLTTVDNHDRLGG